MSFRLSSAWSVAPLLLVALGCGGREVDTSRRAFTSLEVAADAAGEVAYPKWHGEEGSRGAAILDFWRGNRLQPISLAGTCEATLGLEFPGRIMSRAVVLQPDRFAIRFQSSYPSIAFEVEGISWVDDTEWWRCTIGEGREYFAFQYIDIEEWGPFMVHALPFGEGSGLQPLGQLLELVESNGLTFSLDGDIPRFTGAVLEGYGQEAWIGAQVEVRIDPATSCPSRIEVVSDAGSLSFRIEEFRILRDLNAGSLAYAPPEYATVLYDEREEAE